MNNIKFVYLDVGGVALLDFSGTDKWEKLMTEIGIDKNNFDKFNDFYHDLEGKVNIDLDIDDLMPRIEKEFGVKFKNGYSLLEDGFVKRFERNKFIDTVIEEIDKTCGIGLLSNAYPRMLSKVKVQGLLPDFKFDAVVDSSVVKLQKPQEAIYKIAEEKSGFKGNEILFVDNTKRHLDGALKLNWQTFLYDPKKAKESSERLLTLFNSKK